jgi:hypothetical protein
VQTPDITKRLEATAMTLSIDKPIKGKVQSIVPSGVSDVQAELSQVKDTFSLISLQVSDDPVVLIFEVK